MEDIRNFTLYWLGEHKEELKEIEFVVGVSRGGLIPAAIVATWLNKPLVAVYIDKQDNVYMDRSNWLTGKKVLLVDDVVRSGSTMQLMIDMLKTALVGPIKTFTVGMEIQKDPKHEFMSSHSSLINVMTPIRMPWDYDKGVSR